MKLALKLGIQTYQILKNDDEVCIPSLSSIFLALLHWAEHCCRKKICFSIVSLDLSLYPPSSLGLLDRSAL